MIMEQQTAKSIAKDARESAANAPKPELKWVDPPEKYDIYNDLQLAQNEAYWKQREAFGGFFANDLFPGMATRANNIGKGWEPQSDYGKKAFGPQSSYAMHTAINPDAFKGDWYKTPQSVKDAFAKHDSLTNDGTSKPGTPGGGPAGGNMGGGNRFTRNQDMSDVEAPFRSPFAGVVPGHGDPWSGWSGDVVDSDGSGPANNVRNSFMVYNTLMDQNKYDRQVRPDGSILFIDKKTGKGVMVPGNEFSNAMAEVGKLQGWTPEMIGQMLPSPHKMQQFFNTKEGGDLFKKIWSWAQDHGEELGAIGVSVWTGNPVGIVISLLKLGWDAWQGREGGSGGN